MKVTGIALSNMAYKGLSELLSEGDLSRADGYDSRPDDSALLGCEEGEFWLAVKRAMAGRKKRVVIDITYPTSSR